MDNSIKINRQSIFHYFAKLKFYSIVFVDPIDCDNDPCHLSWIVRDYRELLKAVRNGKEFDELDPYDFLQCDPVMLFIRLL